MHFGSLLAITACLASVATSIQFTSWPSQMVVDQPATFKWKGDPDAPATITLQRGPSGNLKDVDVLTTQGHDGSFTWTPNSSIPEGSDYALKIEQGDSVNYSGPITIAAGSKQVSDISSTPASLTTDIISSTAVIVSVTTSESQSQGETATSSEITTSTASVTSVTAESQSTSMSVTSQQNTSSISSTSSSTIITESVSFSSETRLTAAPTVPSTSSNIPTSAQAQTTIATVSTEESKSIMVPTSSTGSAVKPVSTGSASVRRRSLRLVLGAIGLVAYNIH